MAWNILTTNCEMSSLWILCVEKSSTNTISNRSNIFSSNQTKVSRSKSLCSTRWNLQNYEVYMVFRMKFVINKWLFNFWPYIGKAKWHLRASRFFQFSKICLQFSAVCLQFFKKTTTFQTQLGFSYQHRVKSATIQFYCHLLLTIFNRNTLYVNIMNFKGACQGTTFYVPDSWLARDFSS